MEVLLVSTEYIKSRSPLFENVSGKILRESISDCQLLYIIQILGTALYNEIIEQVDAGNVSADNKALLDGYIVNTLKFYALLEAAPFVKVSFVPTGVKTLTQSSSQEILCNEFKSYQAQWQKRSEFWARRAILFLKEQSVNGKYPLYIAGNSRIDEVNPVGSQYHCSMYLGEGLINESCN